MYDFNNFRHQKVSKKKKKLVLPPEAVNQISSATTWRPGGNMTCAKRFEEKCLKAIRRLRATVAMLANTQYVLALWSPSSQAAV
jgi:hypothetical protein